MHLRRYTTHSRHFEYVPQDLEDRACAGRLDRQEFVVRDRVALDLAVTRADVFPDKERLGEWPLADDASPNQRLRT